MNVQLSFEKVDKYYQKILKGNELLEKYSDVSSNSLSYLLKIHGLDNPTLSEVASAMDVKKSSASNMVNKLAERGLVEVNRSDNDKRVCKLSLSQEGLEVVEIGRIADQLFFKRIEEILDGEEFETFMKLWEKIILNLDEDADN